MKLFFFAASASAKSINKKLMKVAAKISENWNHEITMKTLNDFELPLYNADQNEQQGLPEAAKKFIAQMHAADRTIIISPEYNFSIPGTLKNLIDWVSRENPMPWTNQILCLMSASPALAGGNRGLWATRIPLECCGAFVFPNMFSLPKATNAFDESGNLTDAKALETLQKNLQAFLEAKW